LRESEVGRPSNVGEEKENGGEEETKN